MMLILGTSLEVFPVAGLVYQVPSVVPRVLINRDIVDPFCGDNQTRDIDAVYSGDIVEGVRKLAMELEWQDEISKLEWELLRSHEIFFFIASTSIPKILPNSEAIHTAYAQFIDIFYYIFKNVESMAEMLIVLNWRQF